MKNRLFKTLRIFSILFCMIAFIIIAIYPFANRDLTLLVETKNGEYEYQILGDEINDTDSVTLEFSNVNEMLMERIRLYSDIKSICLKSFVYEDFLKYVQVVPEGEFYWTEDGLYLNANNGLSIVLNEKGTEIFQSLSESFLLERICLMEIVLIIGMLMFVTFTALDEKYAIDSYDNHGPIYEFKRFWRDINKYKNYMAYAAKTDLNAEVANSYLNRLWWLLEPFFNMIVYVIVFVGVMGQSIENYATFVFSALLMWNLFNKTINYSVKLVRNNRDILTKVYVPKFVLLISNMILNIYKLLFSMIVLVIMLFVFKVQIGIEILMVIPAYTVMILLSFGIGMIFLHYGVYVDDLSYAVGILLSMMMFLSGIFYEVMTSLTEPLNTLMLCLNPIAMTIDTMRNALLYREVVNVPLIGIWFVISLILCCIGVHIVYKNENGYVKVV